MVKSNVMSCLALFDVMSDSWPLAARCYDIIDHLGAASVALFDSPKGTSSATENAAVPDEQYFGEISAEYMDWFGTRDTSRLPLSSTALGDFTAQNPLHGVVTTQDIEDFPISSVDQMDQFTDMDELFHQGFDMTIPIMMDAFGNEPHSDLPS